MSNPSERPGPLSPSLMPPWFDPNGQPIYFAYSKAFGLAFDPREPTTPILYGGDYDGMYPFGGGSFLRNSFTRTELEREGLGWFLAYAERLRDEVPFTCEQLVADAKAHGSRVFFR